MNTPACFLFAALTVSTLNGCVASLPESAKRLAATQECGGADRIAQPPELMNLYSQCVELQLDAISAREAAYDGNK
ncbi:MAG: hypothetical protein QM706_12135 [Nitrospira sp.]